jgi:hypothetical protein
VLVASLATLCGCASTHALPEATHPTAVTVSVPQFRGPWAEEFAAEYRAATSNSERIALSDGIVSRSEIDLVEKRFVACLEDEGLTSSGFEPDGSVGFGFPPEMGSDVANEIADRCSASSGKDTVGFLYFAMKDNPQNIAEATRVLRHG